MGAPRTVGAIARIEELLSGWERWDPAHEVSIGAVVHDVWQAIEGTGGDRKVDRGE